MNSKQWHDLLCVIKGEKPSSPQIGFMIDSPWLPGWAGISTLEYYTSDNSFIKANLKAIETFPEVMFLPGFWSEFGMCSEPSAFGTKLIWYRDNMPHAEKIIKNPQEIWDLKKPDPTTDGLPPFILQRLKNIQPAMKEAGHEIKFAVSRGPLNIASHLIGMTEFMTNFLMYPDETHRLLVIVSDFIVDWLQLQKETFPTIEGIFINDDMVGFLNEAYCRELALPYLKQIYGAFNTKVNYFHNDAQGLVSASILKEIGINFFNFSFEHSINEIAELTGKGVVLLGNLPPRDVLDLGTPEIVAATTRKMWEEVKDRSRVIWSCGGGMPQNVSTQNILSFIQTIYSCEND
jgi:uroporphyrinogen-III decarboxylase